ncbi:unnamed protein product [Caenorhabditis bovis]|uniref:Uncharacterized protein n=1 Tax=Caenorhabditis bovis TaxID=2654633 RepID=A0A8S1EUD0_9PELO|nr:unnamed protein product [Caenorhabditis bovis]
MANTDYVKIRSIEKGRSSSVVKLYGRIIKIEPLSGSVLLTLTDDVKNIRAHIEFEQDHSFEFQLNQVVRLHRAYIKSWHGETQIGAKIGKQGCHIVVWNAGERDPKNIAFKSSKNWTMHDFDTIMLEKLSRDSENDATDEEFEASEEVDETLEKFKYQLTKIFVKNVMSDKMMGMINDFREKLSAHDLKSDFRKILQLGALSSVIFNRAIWVTPCCMPTKELRWALECPLCIDANLVTYTMKSGPRKCRYCLEVDLPIPSLCIPLRFNIITDSPGVLSIIIPIKTLTTFHVPDKYVGDMAWNTPDENNGDMVEEIFGRLEEWFKCNRILIKKAAIISTSVRRSTAEVYAREVDVFPIMNDSDITSKIF